MTWSVVCASHVAQVAQGVAEAGFSFLFFFFLIKFFIDYYYKQCIYVCVHMCVCVDMYVRYGCIYVDVLEQLERGWFYLPRDPI